MKTSLVRTLRKQTLYLSMKERIHIRWWHHILFVIAYAMIGCGLFLVLFTDVSDVRSYSPKEHDITITVHNTSICLFVFLGIHIAWLIALIIRLLLNKQYEAPVILTLFVAADIALGYLMAFIYYVTMLETKGDGNFL